MAYILADGSGSGCCAGRHDHGHGSEVVNVNVGKRVNGFLLYSRF